MRFEIHTCKYESRIYKKQAGNIIMIIDEAVCFSQDYRFLQHTLLNNKNSRTFPHFNFERFCTLDQKLRIYFIQELDILELLASWYFSEFS